MIQLIDLGTYPIKSQLNLLLKDKTTRRNILFATDAYLAEGITARDEMLAKILIKLRPALLQPRVAKSLAAQAERTKKKAEVFTPSWICNKMNNHCDTEWFGREGVFNAENEDHTWTDNPAKVEFPGGKTWKEYVDSRRLEITCGEAPYIVSRYDATTGDIIPITHRIGIIDRKLRIVNENTSDETEWFKWALRAFQSTYGFEYQGDNLLIARCNLLNTFVDYLKDRWDRDATDRELKSFANIIAWNIWQMDGLTGTVPYSSADDGYHQMDFFDWIGVGEKTENKATECRIYDWRADNSMTYNSLKKRGKQLMKFDFCIGNPPLSLVC